MLFNSYVFILCFLPVTLAGFLLLSHRGRDLTLVWLVFASLVFYAWWEPPYLLLVAASIAGNLGVSRLILRARARLAPRRAWQLLVVAVAANVGLLAWFKYADAVVGTLNLLLGTEIPAPGLKLPLAISFYTLLQIAFVCDVYERKVADLSTGRYVLFVTFFPHMIAGPIIHHREMMPQFQTLGPTGPGGATIARGIFLFSIGLFKKVCIADTLARASDAGFADPAALDFLGGWSTALCYQLQLYFDFSGYSDMAIGLALMFGIVFPLNFDSPYRATDIRDFWHRWHMTLSRFLRDYVYVPLGGNRHGEHRTLRNLLLTFLVGGIWHGAGFNFVLWGLMHGMAMVVHRTWIAAGGRLHAALGWPLTFLFVMLAFVMFRAPDVQTALAIYRAMFDVGSLQASALLTWRIDSTGLPVLQWIEAAGLARFGLGGWGLIATCLALCLFARNSNQLTRDFQPTARSALLCVALLAAGLLALGGEKPFIYFQF